MPFRVWTVAAASIAVLAGAHPVGASEPATQVNQQWETPQSLDGADKRRLDTVNQVTGDGTSVIYWLSRSADRCQNWWAAVRRPGEERWGEPVRLGQDLARAKVVVGGRDSVVAVLQSCKGDDITYRRLGAQGWSSARPVPTQGGDTVLDVADVNGRGTLLVTYERGDLIEGVVHPRHGEWSELPPIKPGRYDSFPTADVDADDRVTYVLPERDYTYRDVLSIPVYTLVEGAWVVERIKPPRGAKFSGGGALFDERGSVAVTALTLYGDEFWVSVRPRGAAEFGEPIQLGDPARDVVGFSGGFQRSGKLVLAWAEEADETRWIPNMSARNPSTGIFSPPARIAPPAPQAYPDADVARDGTVLIEVGLARDQNVLMCDGIRRCEQVGSPVAPPLDTPDFEAGPDRSASVALADERCGEQDCFNYDIRASYLAPPAP